MEQMIAGKAADYHYRVIIGKQRGDDYRILRVKQPLPGCKPTEYVLLHSH